MWMGICDTLMAYVERRFPEDSAFNISLYRLCEV